MLVLKTQFPVDIRQIVSIFGLQSLEIIIQTWSEPIPLFLNVVVIIKPGPEVVTFV